MKRAEFFEGLDSEGVQVTLEEYVNNAGWTVHSMGVSKHGFWILLMMETN